jgi:hypothetical protein
LSRFVTLNRHQLAGQAANLDFWLSQVYHALTVIDGYGPRFVRMHAAQEQYVATHGTKEYALGWEYPVASKAAPPRRIPDREMRSARKSLVEAAYRFVARCHRDHLISETCFLDVCRSLGINTDGESIDQ